MTDAPEQIWLQWEDHAGENTWCDEPISDTDLAYTRTDVAQARITELEGKLERAVDVLAAIVGAWDGPKYDLVMQPNIVVARATLADIKGAGDIDLKTEKGKRNDC